MSDSPNPPSEHNTVLSETMATVAGGASSFPNTRWTLVLNAANPALPQSHDALTSLCEGYWYPIYAFVRRKGHSPEDAQDLTQGFFLQILEGSFFQRANRDKGRFRTFLLVALRFYLADMGDRANARKRGAGTETLPFEVRDGEAAYIREPVSAETPERIFERRWARTVLDRVLKMIKDEFIRHGRLEHFNHLKVYLMGQAEVPYAELAKRLDISESALKSGIHRLRKKYRDLLRAEVASTVSDPVDVDEELRYLLTAISARTTKGG